MVVAVVFGEAVVVVVVVDSGEVHSNLRLVERVELVGRVSRTADTRPRGLKKRKGAMGPGAGS